MRWLAAVIVLAGVLAAPAEALGDELGVTVTSPVEGASVAGVVPLEAMTTGVATSVAFDVSADDVTWTSLGSDDDPADGWSSTWDTAGFEGPVGVRATASDGQASVVAVVHVLVDHTAPTVTLRATNPAFSPNEDGRADRTGIEVVLDEPASLAIWIDGPDGTVRHLLEAQASPAGPSKIRWRGRGDTIRVVPDGPYVVRAEASDAAGNAWTSELTVIVDTKPPRFRWVGIAPDPYRGAGSVRLRFRVRDRAPDLLIGGQILDVGGRPIARIPLREMASGPRRLAWDGTDRSGHRPTPGLLRAVVTVRDDAGNVLTAPAEAFRDHHPVAARVLRRVDGATGLVALTFDDCYDATSWGRILDVLASHRAGGSFFCLGPYVRAYPSLALRTVSDGHTIGGHGWDHRDLRTLDEAQIRSRLALEQEAWWDVAGVTPVPFFRPPYGELDDAAVRAIGAEGFATIALWDVDPWDWSAPGARTVAARVLSHARAGSIVVLHAVPGTATALPAILQGLRARGLEPVTLAELLAAA